MSGILGKANLYILGLQDLRNDAAAPAFYNIGVTKVPVEERIATLQSGNPYSIIPIFTLEANGARIIKKDLHNMFAPHHQIRDWFSLSDTQLKQIKEIASSTEKEIGEKIAFVRKLDQTHSNEVLLNPTEKIVELHRRILKLEGKSTENSLRKAILRHQISNLTGTSKGIPGISRVIVTNPKLGFKKIEFRKAYPDVYNEYMTKPQFKESIKIIGKPTSINYPVLNAQNRAAKTKHALWVITADEVTENVLEPTDEVVSLHEQYSEIISDEATIERDLLINKIELKVACGENRGFTDVCEYIREDIMTFDIDRFKLERPDLYQEFTFKGLPQRRFRVL
jgi:hypothetical protein